MTGPTDLDPMMLSLGEMQQLNHLLRVTFGLSDFRPFQREIITHVLRGQSQLAILSTGAGKSLCYQLPSLMLERPTLVISPLLALMKDQLDGLARLNIAAEGLHHAQTPEEQTAIMRRWAQGDIRLLYVAPERLARPRFIQAMEHMPPGLLVVDEAHCISEWGDDFRPDYRRIRQFRERINQPPVLALTATATPKVRSDILQHLGLVPERCVVTEGDIDRPNIYLRVKHHEKESDRQKSVIDALQEVTGAGIVYTDSRQRAEDWANFLRGRLTEDVAVYHAGLDASHRERIQEGFLQGHIRVVTATTAFGMGIDRPDIERIIHVAVPATIDAYYQEIGRAGRDGRMSGAYMLLLAEDIHRRASLVRRERPQPRIVQSILDRLGDARLGTWVDAPRDAEDLWPAVGAILEELGVAVSSARSWGGVRLRMQEDLYPWVRAAVNDRLSQQYVARQKRWASMRQYVTGAGCRRVMLKEYYGTTVTSAISGPPSCCDNCDQGQVHGATWSENTSLWQQLKDWRTDTAHREGIPPYRVLADRDLADIAAKRPTTLEALRHCRGIGPVKIERYGASLCQIIGQRDEPYEEAMPSVIRSARDLAWRCFEDGMPFEQVAIRVERKPSTVRGYLVEWVQGVPEARWRWYLARWVTDEQIQAIDAALKAHGGRLRGAYDALGGRYSFGTLEVVRAAVSQQTDS